MYPTKPGGRFSGRSSPGLPENGTRDTPGTFSTAGAVALPYGSAMEDPAIYDEDGANSMLPISMPRNSPQEDLKFLNKGLWQETGMEARLQLLMEAARAIVERERLQRRILSVEWRDGLRSIALWHKGEEGKMDRYLIHKRKSKAQRLYSSCVPPIIDVNNPFPPTLVMQYLCDLDQEAGEENEEDAGEGDDLPDPEDLAFERDIEGVVPEELAEAVLKGFHENVGERNQWLASRTNFPDSSPAQRKTREKSRLDLRKLGLIGDHLTPTPTPRSASPDPKHEYLCPYPSCCFNAANKQSRTHRPPPRPSSARRPDRKPLTGTLRAETPRAIGQSGDLPFQKMCLTCALRMAPFRGKGGKRTKGGAREGGGGQRASAAQVEAAYRSCLAETDDLAISGGRTRRRSEYKADSAGPNSVAPQLALDGTYA